MLKAKLNDRVFVLKGVRYFTAGSENIRLGSYGSKTASPVKPNRLNPSFHLNIPSSYIDRVEPIQIELETTKALKGQVDAGMKVADGSAAVTYNAIQSGSLVVIKFNIAEGILREVLNKNSIDLKRFAEIKTRPRIVNQIFVVVSAETASKISAASELHVESKEGSLSVSGSSDTVNNMKIVLAANSTLAYGLLKPQWPRGNKSFVTVFQPDDHGLG